MCGGWKGLITGVPVGRDDTALGPVGRTGANAGVLAGVACGPMTGVGIVFVFMVLVVGACMAGGFIIDTPAIGCITPPLLLLLVLVDIDVTGEDMDGLNTGKGNGFTPTPTPMPN